LQQTLDGRVDLVCTKSGEKKEGQWRRSGGAREGAVGGDKKEIYSYIDMDGWKDEYTERRSEMGEGGPGPGDDVRSML
jgi:hypothetical protein